MEIIKRKRISKEELSYINRKRLWFDRIYPLLKNENLEKDKISKIGNKISEIALHLIQLEYEHNKQ